MSEPVFTPDVKTTSIPSTSAEIGRSREHALKREESFVVLVVHASVGSGHRSAALAIREALETLRRNGHADIPHAAEIELLDILDFGRISIDGDKTASMFTGPTRPIYDITWRYTLTGRLLWGGGTAWSRVMFGKFTDYVERRRPAAVICTHITAANAAVGARMLTGQRFPIVCVPTDYEIEGWWPHKETDLFCVATEAMAETLRPRKVPESKMSITGIPVRAGMGAPCDRAAIRKRYELPQDKAVVLVMAGAHLPQPYVRFRETMDKAMPAMKSMADMHFVFLPGRDEAYAAHLEEEKRLCGLTNMTIMGYVDDMPELMAASDLAICKSGGLTVTECLCARLPMVLLGQSYGQEKANTRMLTSLGVGMHVTTARELIGALRHLHANPSSLRAMLVNGEILRRPDAATDIAKQALALVGSVEASDKHFVEFYWGEKPAHTR
ncbi:MAG: glycosyltransferase [Slackia sp.]|nr:glycosyltransferase [Slackia sp.]